MDIVELSQVADSVEYGVTASASDQPVGPKFLRITDIQDGQVDWDSVPYCSAEDKKLKAAQLQIGDIVFARTGATTGKSYLISDCPEDAVFASYLIRVRPTSRVLPEYLAYYFQSPSYWAQVLIQATGSAQPGVNASKLKELKLPLLPHPEQRRIVEILDEAFAAIDQARANVERNKANARELFDSTLNSIFANPGPDWEESTLGEIALIKGGKRVPKGYKFLSEPTGYPYISVANFNDDGSVDVENVRYISKEVYEQIKRYTISHQDLYISIAGTIGKSGTIPVELEGANLTENACKLVFKSNVFNRFVYYFTRTDSFNEQALKNTRVAAQPKLALERLSTISLFMPSRDEQTLIVEKLDALYEEAKQLEDVYQRKLNALEDLKQSLLHQAFTGQLTKAPEEALEAIPA